MLCTLCDGSGWVMVPVADRDVYPTWFMPFTTFTTYFTTWKTCPECAARWLPKSITIIPCTIITAPTTFPAPLEDLPT